MTSSILLPGAPNRLARLWRRIIGKRPWPVIEAVAVGGRDLFVDREQGNDSNAGTFNSPFYSLQHAVDVSEDGDRIILWCGDTQGGHTQLERR